MKKKLYVIKIGGGIIDDANGLNSFLADFARLSGPKILVHGGGNAATRLSDQLGIPTSMINGRRVTSAENLSVVTMVYAGLINKTICAELQGNNCNAIGLSGADANSILSAKRNADPIDYGYVGDIVKVNIDTVRLFLANNMTPVFCAIGHDGNGQLLNTNADTIAAEIAIAMADNMSNNNLAEDKGQEYEVELIYCFDKKGVLADANDENSVIASINRAEYSELKANGIINSGMLPKMENCFHALENNVSEVIIGNASVINKSNKLYTKIML